MTCKQLYVIFILSITNKEGQKRGKKEKTSQQKRFPLTQTGQRIHMRQYDRQGRAYSSIQHSRKYEASHPAYLRLLLLLLLLLLLF